MTRQFMRFLLVGGIAAVANIGSRALFSLWMAFVPAMVLAFLVGLSTAFVMNRNWVFFASGRHWSNEAAWFTLINLLGLLQTLLIAWILARHVFPGIGWTTHAETVAHSVGVVVPIVTSFLGHKFLTFRKHQHA
jgi:putative flippase GtrA